LKAIIKKETGYEAVVRIHLAQDRAKWWHFVNTAVKFLVP